MRRVSKASAARDWEKRATQASRRLRGPSKFLPNIWSEVKGGLYEAQGRKCCYCESRVEERYNDVEHFRPKSTYWWLAYELKNLFFSCANCNRGKGDNFPVSGRRLAKRRLPWFRSAWRQEAALIICPDGLEGALPEDHVTFRQVGGRWLIVGLSPRGKATIKACQLDRDDLNLLRQEHVSDVLEPALLRWKVARPSERRRREKELCDHAHPQRRFSGLALAFLRHHGVLLAQDGTAATLASPLGSR
ncbi:MAG: HNH endonuclease [Deltaproteobacteria bacterium]|nr:HNH endonuclease [Deltaproteobacteria bacterium]